MNTQSDDLPLRYRIIGVILVVVLYIALRLQAVGWTGRRVLIGMQLLFLMGTIILVAFTIRNIHAVQQARPVPCRVVVLHAPPYWENQ